MLYERETTGSVAEVCERLTRAAAAYHFGVLGTHDLKEKMAVQGVEFGPQCRIVEVCNPAQAKTVLEADLSIATALPCRIAVFEEGGKVKVATLRPTAMLALFENPDLAPVAEEVEDTIIRIIERASD